MTAHIAACDSLPGWTFLDTKRTVYSFHLARRITIKIIGIEEHYGLPFIHDAAFKANDPYELVLETMRKSGQFPRKLKDRAPSGHLRSGRGANLCDGRRRH